MRERRLLVRAALCFGGAFLYSALFVGCAAFTAAKGGVDSVKGGVDSVKSGVESGKKTAEEETAKAKAEAAKARGEGGAAGGAGGGAGGAGGADGEDDDDSRIKAKATPLDTPINDELNAKKGDKVDWKAYDLSRIPARTWVTFRLNWDEPGSEINLDVYDQLGAQVVQSPGRSGTAQKMIPLRVDAPGTYYARIRIMGAKDATVYTAVLMTGKKLNRPRNTGAGDKGAPPAAAPAAQAPAAAPAAQMPGQMPGAMPGQMPGAMPGQMPGAMPGQMPGAMPGQMPGAMPGQMPGAMPGQMPGAMPGQMPGAMPGQMPGQMPGAMPPGATAGGAPPIPQGAIVGKIVQAFRGEDGKMTLYLNKGSSAKLKVGMSGTVLQGSEGGQPLEGATFTITKVIGGGQSVAATTYDKPLGKNNRFMVTK